MRPRSSIVPKLVSAQIGFVPYAPGNPPMRNNRITDRYRQARVWAPLLGRPMPSPGRYPILDDALLGSAWRWDADDERGIPTR